MPRRKRTPTEENFWKRNSKPASQRKLRQLAELYELDLRSIRVLFNGYVDFDQREKRPIDEGALIPAEEREHLVEAGVVPEPGDYSADELLDWLMKEKRQVQRERLADAFIAGMTSGRYDWRSALGSYASFHGLTARNRKSTVERGIDGLPDSGQREHHDFIYFAHRRLWKPYVFHARADYAAFDLHQFNHSPPADPGKAERDNFRRLLDAIRELPEDSKLTELQRALTGLVRGDKYDRQHVLEILGYCDILGHPRGQKPIRKRYMNQLQRPQPDHFYSRDSHYPLNFWNSGEMGVDEEAVAYWFPGFEQ